MDSGRRFILGDRVAVDPALLVQMTVQDAVVWHVGPGRRTLVRPMSQPRWHPRQKVKEESWAGSVRPLGGCSYTGSC